MTDFDPYKLRHSIELILNKCHFDLPEWKDKELAVVNNFALYFFRELFQQQETAKQAHEYLTMFYVAGLNIQPLLDDWRTYMDDAERLLGFIYLVSWCHDDGEYDNNFADKKMGKIIGHWLAELQFKERLSELLICYLEDFELLNVDEWLIESTYSRLEQIKYCAYSK